MTSESICGKCGTPLVNGSCPQCKTKPAASAKGDFLATFLIIGLLCSSLLMLGTSVVNVTTAPAVASVAKPAETGDLTPAAYAAAIKFVEEKFPGKKRFSEMYNSSVERNGNSFAVTLSADDLSQAAPVRNFFRVEMEYNSGDWKLNEIKQ